MRNWQLGNTEQSFDTTGSYDYRCLFCSRNKYCTSVFQPRTKWWRELELSHPLRQPCICKIWHCRHCGCRRKIWKCGWQVQGTSLVRALVSDMTGQPQPINPRKNSRSIHLSQYTPSQFEFILQYLTSNFRIPLKITLKCLKTFGYILHFSFLSSADNFWGHRAFRVSQPLDW